METLTRPKSDQQLLPIDGYMMVGERELDFNRGNQGSGWLREDYRAAVLRNDMESMCW